MEQIFFDPSIRQSARHNPLRMVFTVLASGLMSVLVFFTILGFIPKDAGLGALSIFPLAFFAALVSWPMFAFLLGTLHEKAAGWQRSNPYVIWPLIILAFLITLCLLLPIVGVVNEMFFHAPPTCGPLTGIFC